MTSFDDRKKAFEEKFAHDTHLQFRAEARRNKLLGLWAAGLIGHSGDAAAAYAQEVVVADLQEAGDEDVFRKLKADLGGKASDEEIRRQMSELMAAAKEQLAQEM